MKKPLGELYSGEADKSLESELSAEPEQMTEKAKELLRLLQTADNRVHTLHEILKKYEDDLRLIKGKLSAMPLKMRLAAEGQGINLETTAEEFSLLQNFAEEIEQKIVKTIGHIKGYEGKIKEMEMELEKESRKNPNIGQA
ncbi:hypothetical protein HYT45_01235 [Candidatus Uhrbacteria bacterium]|nr:hypothetical protein [Candidatus Uhrbacteria bacterium]